MTDTDKSKSVVVVAPAATKEKVDDVVVEEEEEEVKVEAEVAEVEEVEVEEVEDVAAVVEEVAKSAAADISRDVNMNHNIMDNNNNNDDGTPSGKRRFFPRVKHLLTPEWEFFLQGVLSSLESAGAPLVAAASHKAGNPWYKAFHGVYGGVAADCSIPTGKNRYHKFKDKIVELWTAMEQIESHPLKDMGVRQINSYRLACENKISNKDSSPSTPKTPKTLTPATPGTAASNKRAGSDFKTPNNNTANKRPNLGNNPTHVPPQQWRHLDEEKALKNLPEPLQSLVHLRHLGNEVQSTDNQTQLVEISYQRALSDFLESPLSKLSSETLMEMAQSCLALWRCSKRLQKSAECKAILFMYHSVVQDYLQSLPLPSASGLKVVTV